MYNSPSSLIITKVQGKVPLDKPRPMVINLISEENLLCKNVISYKFLRLITVFVTNIIFWFFFVEAKEDIEIYTYCI